jgi:hypothetical protein
MMLTLSAREANESSHAQAENSPAVVAHFLPIFLTIDSSS